MMKKPERICVVGEWLHGVLDEGIHNLAQKLVDQWAKDFQVGTIKIGADLHVNRLFLSFELHKMLKGFHPDLVFYISPSGAKIAALFRAKMLQAYTSQARVLLVATQPAYYKSFERRLLSLLAPNGIFVQSPHGKELLKGVGCPVYFLPSGVDLERFVPVEAGLKIALRKRYGVDEKALVVLHVGHIGHERNVQLLSHIARLRDTQVLLVGSTSTQQDETLIRQLTLLKVRVIREFVPHIEELYQLADIYFFPVISEHAAIGVPLSVLEAMACNLPVITTRFGGLPYMFQEGQGLFYFDNQVEVPDLVRQATCRSQCLTRQRVRAYAWDSVARRVLTMAQGEETPIWH
jgi:glycosyltransferase involved in cell wall biosynthesis